METTSARPSPEPQATNEHLLYNVEATTFSPPGKLCIACKPPAQKDKREFVHLESLLTNETKVPLADYWTPDSSQGHLLLFVKPHDEEEDGKKQKKWYAIAILVHQDPVKPFGCVSEALHVAALKVPQLDGATYLLASAWMLSEARGRDEVVFAVAGYKDHQAGAPADEVWQRLNLSTGTDVEAMKGSPDLLLAAAVADATAIAAGRTEEALAMKHFETAEKEVQAVFAKLAEEYRTAAPVPVVPAPAAPAATPSPSLEVVTQPLAATNTTALAGKQATENAVPAPAAPAATPSPSLAVATRPLAPANTTALAGKQATENAVPAPAAPAATPLSLAVATRPLAPANTTALAGKQAKENAVPAPAAPAAAPSPSLAVVTQPLAPANTTALAGMQRPAKAVPATTSLAARPPFRVGSAHANRVLTTLDPQAGRQRQPGASSSKGPAAAAVGFKGHVAPQAVQKAPTGRVDSSAAQQARADQGVTALGTQAGARRRPPPSSTQELSAGPEANPKRQKVQQATEQPANSNAAQQAAVVQATNVPQTVQQAAAVQAHSGRPGGSAQGVTQQLPSHAAPAPSTQQGGPPAPTHQTPPLPPAQLGAQRSTRHEGPLAGSLTAEPRPLLKGATADGLIAAMDLLHAQMLTQGGGAAGNPLAPPPLPHQQLMQHAAGAGNPADLGACASSQQKHGAGQSSSPAAPRPSAPTTYQPGGAPGHRSQPERLPQPQQMQHAVGESSNSAASWSSAAQHAQQPVGAGNPSAPWRTATHQVGQQPVGPGTRAAPRPPAPTTYQPRAEFEAWDQGQQMTGSYVPAGLPGPSRPNLTGPLAYPGPAFAMNPSMLSAAAPFPPPNLSHHGSYPGIINPTYGGHMGGYMGPPNGHHASFVFNAAANMAVPLFGYPARHHPYGMHTNAHYNHRHHAGPASMRGGPPFNCARHVWRGWAAPTQGVVRAELVHQHWYKPHARSDNRAIAELVFVMANRTPANGKVHWVRNPRGQGSIRHLLIDYGGDKFKGMDWWDHVKVLVEAKGKGCFTWSTEGVELDMDKLFAVLGMDRV